MGGWLFTWVTGYQSTLRRPHVSTYLYLSTTKQPRNRTADAPEHEPEDEAEEADPDVALRPPAPAADLLFFWGCSFFGRMNESWGARHTRTGGMGWMYFCKSIHPRSTAVCHI